MTTPGALLKAHGNKLNRLRLISLLHLVCDCIKVCMAASHELAEASCRRNGIPAVGSL